MRFKFGTAIMLMVGILCGMTASGAASIIEDTVDIIKLIQSVTTSVLRAWDLLGELPSSNELPIMLDKSRQIMDSMEMLNQQIRHTEELQAEYFTLTIETLKRDFRAEAVLSHKLLLVSDMTKMITTRYDLMIPYQSNKGQPEMYSILGYAEWCVKPGPSSLAYLLNVLHDEFFGEPEDVSVRVRPLFAQVVMNYEENVEQLCATGRSPQQFAYDLYTKAALTEIKAYIMMEFSWMALRNSGKGNFTQERTLMNENYQRRMLHSQQLLREIMTNTGRVYWRCDPKPGQHMPGKTYDQVTRLLQGYVENEINMNTDSSCFNTCEDYDNVHTTECYGDEFCKKQPNCAGRLHSCRFIESDMSVCRSKDTNSSIRYNYIEFNSGRCLGDHGGSCEKGCPDHDRVESWSFYLFWRCNYCFCLCDEEGLLSDRYFNLRDTLSDFNRNMIVTGARFVKDQRVFHLQLQQGELLPGGLINQSSLAWIPLESFDVSHVDIRDGYDYHKLSYDSRALDLDEISAKNDSLVVTGARFRVLDKHLNLEVRFSAINFTTGRLVQPELNSFWLGNNNKEPRQLLLLKDPNVPTKSTLLSEPLSENNQFMEFVSSSVDKDAAQNTVPYIDVQDVVPNPAVPLSGLGIYHKGRNGFGGFFAPKIVTFNLSQKLMRPNF